MIPTRSLDQRMRALAGANEIRLYRAYLKRDLATGTVSAVDTLLAPTPQINMMKVEELLEASPGIGPIKAAAMLQRAKASHSKTVGGLSLRQRRELVALLRTHEQERQERRAA